MGFFLRFFCARPRAESPEGARFGDFSAGPGPMGFCWFSCVLAPGVEFIFFGFDFWDSGRFGPWEAGELARDVLLLRKAASRAWEANICLHTVQKALNFRAKVQKIEFCMDFL